MSILGLLTRGTKFQKVKKSGTTTTQPIPSAGPINPPELYQILDANDHDTLHRGKKRKRGGSSAEIVNNVPAQLDFFASKSQTQNLPLLGDEGKEAESAQFENHREKAQDVTLVEPELDEQRCRQILKKHKLSIISFGEEDGIMEVRKGKPKRKKEHERSRKTSKQHTRLTPRPLVSFSELPSRYHISKRLAENIQFQGYTQPTEVQLGSLPILLGSDSDRGLEAVQEERSKTRSDVDLLTVAPTGSGKTLAFLIHLLHALLEDRRSRKDTVSTDEDPAVQALIITPTQELTDQIVNEGKKLAHGTGVSISALKKGVCLHPEMQNIRHGDQDDKCTGDDDKDDSQKLMKHKTMVKSSILVSTHSLLLSTITPNGSEEPLSLPNVRYLILDEADLLLSHPWQPTTLKIWSALPSPRLQVSLWSATIGSSIESLTRSFITQRRQTLGLPTGPPHHHLVRLIVGLKDTAIPNITHTLTYCATEQGKLLALRQLLNPSHRSTTAVSSSSPALHPPFLVFTQTIPRAIALHSELKYDIPPEAGGPSRIAVLHSDLSSPLRSETISRFRKGEVWILITTDLLSRGVDFRGLNGVVNYDIPTSSAGYVHRAGRTGRQGREGGVCVTLYTKEDLPYVKNVANVIAASEKARAKTPQQVHGGTTTSSGASSNSINTSRPKNTEKRGVEQWLLDALPDVDKKTRKQLKRKGVESRRIGFEDREGRKARISTKSGYQRRLEQRRKGAPKVGGGRRVADGMSQEMVASGAGGGAEEWDGFGD